MEREVGLGTAYGAQESMRRSFRDAEGVVGQPAHARGVAHESSRRQRAARQLFAIVHRPAVTPIPVEEEGDRRLVEWASASSGSISRRVDLQLACGKASFGRSGP